MVGVGLARADHNSQTKKIIGYSKHLKFFTYSLFLDTVLADYELVDVGMEAGLLVSFLVLLSGLYLGSFLNRFTS